MRDPGVVVAEWQMFPWGTLLTLALVLATLLFAAAVNKAREIFRTKEEAAAGRKELIGILDGFGDRLKKVEVSCAETARVADEAWRLAQLIDRGQTEQWKRISEEIIQPVREMSRELRETRETLVKYIQTQDTHGRDIARLEKRMDARRE